MYKFSVQLEHTTQTLAFAKTRVVLLRMVNSKHCTAMEAKDIPSSVLDEGIDSGDGSSGYS